MMLLGVGSWIAVVAVFDVFARMAAQRCGQRACAILTVPAGLNLGTATKTGRTAAVQILCMLGLMMYA
jgi:hypothetical protein